MGAYPVNQFTKVVQLAPRGEVGHQTAHMLVAASQTIQEGDLLVFSSGRLTQAVALPSSNNTFDASAGSLGDMFVALAPITTSGSVTDADRIPVAPLNANLMLHLRIFNTTAGDSEQQDLTVGTSYRVGRYRGESASIWWYAMSTNSTNGDLKYLNASKDSAASDDYGLGYFGK